MADVNANIGVNIDTSQALAELKNLQRQISQFHSSIARSSATVSAAQRGLQTDFLNAINATGKFAAEMRTIKTASESFTDSLEKNKFSMGEYFRYAGGASKSFGRLFRTEFDTINKVAEDRVKKLQTQYIKMGRDANGALKAISVTPLALDMNNLQTKTMIAAQRQQLFNELLSKGTTNLINFGKNTQWAGRQLMVGFTIPLTIFGSKATQVFLEIEQQALRFKRVYGDLFTNQDETQANLDSIRGLAQEFTKYGVAVKDTMTLAADAASAGFTGAKLQETVTQATRLSVLGEVDKQEAFKATISLQSAFKMSNEELANSVNFLNAVENQSVTSLADMTEAIPKVAPIIRGLGGDIKDMAVFLTAMKEGGVNAAESANGLKSALASMINPSKAAKEMLAGVGVDLQAITERNKGNLMRTVLELGDALKGLEPLARTRVLEKLFGKYQFARVSALFDNISRSGSQAQRTLELMSMSAIDLAQIANRELTAIEENSATKFKASVEALKTAIAPIGDVFIQTVTPVIEFITKLADKFSGLSDHTKKVIAVILTVIGGVAPVVLMLVGLFANFFGQMMKFFALLRNGYTSLSGGSQVLGEQTNYLNSTQVESLAIASSLDQIHAKLIQKFTVEADALVKLRTAYVNAAQASQTFAASNPNMLIPGRRGPRKKYADGVEMVPGSGSGDTVPAMLEPGEAVIPKTMAKKYGGLINGMIADNIPGYKLGKGYKNATVFMPESMNTTMGQAGSPGVATQEVSSYFKQAGGAAMGPLMAVMAKEMGLKLNDPKFKQEWSRIGGQLSKTVVTALNTSAQTMVTDENFEEIVVPALRKTAKTLNIEGRNLGSAFDNAVNEIRTVGPVGGKGGTKGGLGRTSFSRGYRLERVAAQEFAMSDNPNMFQRQERFSKSKQKMVPSFRTFNTSTKEWEVGTMAHITKSITASTDQLLAKMKPYLGNVGARLTRILGDATADGMAKEAQVASPSKKARKVGKDTTAGAILGMKDGAKEARAAGRIIGAQATAGVIEGGSAGGGNGGNTTFLGMPGMGAPKGPGKFASAMTKIRGVRPGGAMMGASGAVLGASMLPGAVGNFAQKLIPATMALQTMAMLNGPLKNLLSNPWGAAAAGIAAIVISTKLYNDAAEKGAEKLEQAAQRQAEAVLGSTDAIKGFGKFIGMNSPSQREFSRNNRRIITADEAKVMTYSNYYKSNEGSASSQILTSAASKGQGASASAMDIAQRAAVFGLSPKDIAANIRAAAKLTGADELKIKSKIEQMLFNGKDLTKEPLTIDARMNFLNSQTKNNLDTLKTDIEKIGKIDLSKSGALAPAAYNYQGLRKAAGAQQSINESYSGGIGGNIMGFAKQTFRFAKNSVSDTGIIQTQNVIKDFNAVQTDIAIASTKIKVSFEQENQYLGILNAQYDDGAITQEQYNKAFAESAERIRNVTTAQKDLIDQLEKLDPTGKAASAAVDDLVNNALADLEKSNPKLFKQIKKDIMAMPKKARVEVAMNYANGSFTVVDIIQLKKYLDALSSGKSYSAIISLAYDDKASAAVIAQLTRDRLLADAAANPKKYKPGSRGKANLDMQVSRQNKIIADPRKINPIPKEKEGTGTGGDDTGTKTQSSFLDAIVKQMRDVNFMNQKLTEGFANSKAALTNLLKKPQSGVGLEEWLKEQGANKPLADLILGMSPSEWEEAKGTIFNFDKATGKLKSLTDWAKKLGAALGTMLVDGFIKNNKDMVTSVQNQQNVLTKLTSTGMSYGEALDYIGNMSPEVIAQLAGTDVATSKWNELKASIDAANSALASTPEGAYNAIMKASNTATEMIDAQAAVIQANNEAQFNVEEAAIKSAETAIQNAQNLIEPLQSVIDANNNSIDLLNRRIELEFDRPLQKLSDESAILSNNLSIIDHQAEAINKQYDDQAKALSEVNKLNQDAINQGKMQISIADALTQGDISAAAQAVQDSRAAAAASAAQSQQDMLEAARKQAIDGLTAGGMTKAQIEQRQYQISQLSFALEQQRKLLQDQVIVLQDANYAKEREIYNIKVTQLDPAQKALEIAQYNLKTHQDRVAEEIKSLTWQGKTKEEWLKIEANAKLALLVVKDVEKSSKASADAAAALQNTYKELDGLRITTFEDHYITNYVTTISTGVTDGSTGSSGSSDSAAGGGGRGGDRWMSTGGKVAQYFADGGGPRGTDTVPAWLTPGEYVVNAKASRVFGPLLEAINSGQFPSFKIDRNLSSPSYSTSQPRNINAASVIPQKNTEIQSDNSNTVYNYSLSFNINGDNVNSSEIANTVMNKIRQLQDQQLRGQVRL